MDDDISPNSRPQIPKPTSTAQPSSTATAATSSDPQPSSSSETVKAVIVRCIGDNGPSWSATTIPSDHPVFNNTVPPVPALLDFPIAIHRLGTPSNGAYDCLDNQAITYLNIEPESGFAPPQWQSGIGSVIVARKDKRDLSPEHYEAIWMYCDYILEYFGDGSAPKHLYNRQAFERWFAGYKRDSAYNGRSEWSSVAPLYEV